MLSMRVMRLSMTSLMGEYKGYILGLVLYLRHIDHPSMTEMLGQNTRPLLNFCVYIVPFLRFRQLSRIKAVSSFR